MQVLKIEELSSLERGISIVLAAAGLLTAFIYLFNIGVGFWGQYIVGWGYIYAVLAFFIPQVFIYYPLGRGLKFRVLDYLAVILFLITMGYFIIHGEDIINFAWELSPPPLALIMGGIASLLALEACRRSVGYVFFFICIFFFFYPLFASYMPGPLFSRAFSFSRLLGFHVMGPDSMVGVPTKVLGNLFIGFLFFGVALTESGASRFFLNLSLSLLGHVRGGTAKVSILSSALTGSISGSVVTNVVTTGSFTIPAMKNSGYPSFYAAAIETCASSGGVLMPPIMGAAAFLMASMLDISYASVAYAAILPSVLFYIGLFIQVDGFAAKNNLKGSPREELPKFLDTLKSGWYYLISFAILIYVLFVWRQEAQAPFYAGFFILGLYIIKEKIYLRPKRIGDIFLKTGATIGNISAILCAVGFLIGSLLLTGVAQTLSSELIAIAGNNVFVLVCMGFVASFVLGTGLSVTACYLLLAVLLAPALIRVGLDPLAVHIFIIYCGTLSFITPPVAIAAFAAASVANASPFKTAKQAVLLGTILFCIPFFIVFDPAYILKGSVLEVLLTVVGGIYGVVLLASAIEGYLVFCGRLKPVGRVLAAASAICILAPELGLAYVLAGIGVSLLIFASYKLPVLANLFVREQV
ncbi:MAG: TRAP transporter fused permease subunit [Desulfarculaceae bacterium]|nr:TRAP transporter fused permease subunit [Desulfarculaceae bacterium]